MVSDELNDKQTLTAGAFSSWVVEMQAAILGEGESDVPCGGCTACCTSSQFIHISPDETDALSHIPAHLLFPAPRLPSGHVLLGYDEQGHCPMLVDDQCSIYEHRPKTCRTYDCRIFPAAGLKGDDDNALIARQARRWQFSFPSAADQIEHDAVRAAATFLDGHRDLLSEASVAANATQLAVLAIEIHHVFLRKEDATGQTRLVDPDPDVVRAEVMAISVPICRAPQP
jgi:Fe-S-cluster containining protein